MTAGECVQKVLYHLGSVCTDALKRNNYTSDTELDIEQYASLEEELVMDTIYYD
jgi:hypothetical protein